MRIFHVPYRIVTIFVLFYFNFSNNLMFEIHTGMRHCRELLDCRWRRQRVPVNEYLPGFCFSGFCLEHIFISRGKVPVNVYLPCEDSP